MINRIFIAGLFFLIALAVVNTDCGDIKGTIVIGSKNFTEQIILGQIMSLMLESNTDLKVDTRLNLAGTFVCFNALKNGDIDLYPEYTGTGLIAILKKKGLSHSKEETFRIVKHGFRDKFDLIFLKPFGFNNTYTITMREEQAKKLGIKEISDLKEYEEILTPGFNHEFLERPDGYKGLCKKYNLHFKHETREFDTGLMYKAIVQKEVDLICGFATDGRIPAFELVILEDNMKFFPPYYAAPLVRADVLEKYPVIEDVLNRLGGLITDEEIRRLNYRVDQQGINAKMVARNFLIEKNLLKE